MTLTEQAKKAIDKLFSDCSHSRADTLRELEDVLAHLEIYLEDLRGDEDA